MLASQPDFDLQMRENKKNHFSGWLSSIISFSECEIVDGKYTLTKNMLEKK